MGGLLSIAVVQCHNNLWKLLTVLRPWLCYRSIEGKRCACEPWAVYFLVSSEAL